MDKFRSKVYTYIKKFVEDQEWKSGNSF
jgi:hypothetical protein